MLDHMSLLLVMKQISILYAKDDGRQIPGKIISGSVSFSKMVLLLAIG